MIKIAAIDPTGSARGSDSLTSESESELEWSKEETEKNLSI